MVSRRRHAAVWMAVWAACVLAIAGFIALNAGRSSAAANNDKPTVDIARQEIALAKDALHVMAQLENTGTLAPGSLEVRTWSRRLAEATRRSGAPKSEVIAVLKQHLARASERAAMIKRMHETAGASQMALYGAQYEVLEAQRWLAEEQE